MGAALKKRWETRDQMIGPKPDDQKELRILNRTLQWCKDGLVFAAILRHGKEVVDELGLSKSNLAHDQLDLKYATSCLASAVSSPGFRDIRAAKRVGRYLRKALVAWQGFSFS